METIYGVSMCLTCEHCSRIGSPARGWCLPAKSSRPTAVVEKTLVLPVLELQPLDLQLVLLGFRGVERDKSSQAQSEDGPTDGTAFQHVRLEVSAESAVCDPAVGDGPQHPNLSGA